MENAKAERVNIINSSFYLALNLSPINEYPDFYPELGYRYQKKHLGLDVSLGINGKAHDFFMTNLALNLLIYPNPNSSSQFYLGLGANGGFSSTKHWYRRPKTYSFYGYYEYYYYTYNKLCSYRHNSFLLYPTFFIGKDFSFPKGQKIFGEILFIPRVFSTNRSEWDWLTSLGFKIGYGF